MKNTLASSSPLVALRTGRNPVVAVYLSVRPPARASCRVTIGSSSAGPGRAGSDFASGAGAEAGVAAGCGFAPAGGCWDVRPSAMRNIRHAEITPATSLYVVAALYASARLQPTSQHFGHAPRLRHTPARRVRLLGIEHFADGSDARLAEVPGKPREQVPCARPILRVHPQPGVDHGANQPAPHGALVVGGVSRAQVAVIGRLVVGMAWRQRTQANRRQQSILDDIYDGCPAGLFEHRVLERYRQQLIGPARSVVSGLAVHDVIQVAACLVPEAAVERLATAISQRRGRQGGLVAFLLAQPSLQQPKRVVPERVDFNGLASARCDDPVADLRIHPRELVALCALTQQPIARVHADAEPRAAHVMVDDVAEHGK